MGVGAGVPVAGEMLQAAVDAGFRESADVGGDQRGGDGGLVAEGPRADDDVVGVGVDVGHRGEVDVEAVSAQVGPDAVRSVVGRLRASGRHGGHAPVVRHVEGRVRRQPADAAAFFVDAEQGSARQGAQVPDESA